MPTVRKLAAIDLHFLGTKLILAEFALGVIGPIFFGIWTLRVGNLRSHSWQTTAFGAYLFLLGINYLPLLLHAVGLVRDGSASAEIADDLEDKRTAFQKYRRYSLLLLLPLVVPVVALIEEIYRARLESTKHSAS